MSGKKKKKSKSYKDFSLNIMPFIDVFSLLNTFLLMSAVFLSVGVLEVQIPFLTSAPPDKKVEEKSCDVKVDLTKEGVEATAANCGVESPKKFATDKGGLANLHTYLVALRKQNLTTDKVSFFSDDEVLWKDIAAVLDAVKVRKPSDPVFAPKTGTEIERAVASEFLFPKVVMASVMLK